MKKNYQNKAIIAGMMLIAIGVYTQTTSIHSLTLSAQARDGVSGGSDDDSSSSQDQDDDSDESSSDSKSMEKAGEAKTESVKKALERQRESAKKIEEIKRESAKKQADILKRSQEHANENKMSEVNQREVEANDISENDSDESDVEDTQDDNENNDAMDDNGGNRSRFDHVAEKIAEAEKRILEQQNEGKDVTIALERLAQAKAMIKNADTSLLNTQGKDESDDFLKEAFKLTHRAKGDDIRSINDADKFVKKAAERIIQANKKLSQLSATGGDTTQYQAMIDIASADLSSAQELLIQNKILDGAALAQKAEGEAKSAKKAIESALLALGVDDDELSGDHKSVVAKAVEDLLFVADAEGDNKIGKKVRDIARAQRDSADTVNTLVDDAQSRSGFATLVLGPKYNDLNGIQKQITDNAARIQSLMQVKTALTDVDLQAVVSEHIAALTEENAKLQSFVTGKEKSKGIFGWVFRLLQ